MRTPGGNTCGIVNLTATRLVMDGLHVVDLHLVEGKVSLRPDQVPALNASRIDQISLECAGSNVPLSLLRLLPDKQLMVGAIQVTGDRVESPAEVAATLRAAAEHVDVERILPCTNCGMTPISYDAALGKLQALGAGADLLRRELAS